MNETFFKIMVMVFLFMILVALGKIENQLKINNRRRR